MQNNEVVQARKNAISAFAANGQRQLGSVDVSLCVSVCTGTSRYQLCLSKLVFKESFIKGREVSRQTTHNRRRCETVKMDRCLAKLIVTLLLLGTSAANVLPADLAPLTLHDKHTVSSHFSPQNTLLDIWGQFHGAS